MSYVWLWACSETVAHRGEVVVRVAVQTPEELARIAAKGDLWSEHVVDSAVIALHRRELSDIGPYEMLIDDLPRAIDGSMSSLGGTSTVPVSFWEDWHDLEDIEAHMEDLAARGGEASLVSIGTSLEGRDILALEIRRPSVRPDSLGILVTGTQHAREWVAASSALWMAEHLVDGSGTDADVDLLLDEWRVIIVPVVNPDGYRYSWTTDRLWRKNRRDNGDGSFGVDLNRNWDLAWSSVGSSDLGTSDNYHGTEAFSEPESAAVAHLLARRSKVGIYLDLHSFSQLVLHSFAFTSLPAPDDLALGAAGTSAADAMAALSGTTWSAGSLNTQLYPGSGVGIDWAYAERGVSAWLFELRDRGQYGFLLPADQIVDAAEEAWAGLLALTASERPRLSLSLSVLTAGSPATASVDRADAGANIEIYTSAVGPGTTVLSDGVVIELAGATLLGSTTASDHGRRTLSFDVAAGTAGSTLWAQARSGMIRSAPVSDDVQ